MSSETSNSKLAVLGTGNFSVGSTDLQSRQHNKMCAICHSFFQMMIKVIEWYEIVWMKVDNAIGGSKPQFV